MTAGIATLLIASATLWFCVVFALGLAAFCLHYVVSYITRGQYNGSDAHTPADRAGRVDGRSAVAR